MWECGKIFSTFPHTKEPQLSTMAKYISLKNFTSGYNYCMRYLERTINHPQQKVIEKRLKIMEFFDKYGADATKEAFGYSRSTVYSWKKKLREGRGALNSLSNGDRTPLNKRTRKVNQNIKDFIISYRREHHGVGKEIIKPALDEFCLEMGIPSISESTIGRVIADLKKEGWLLNQRIKVRIHGGSGNLMVKKKRNLMKNRRKDFKPKKPGDLLQIDSITVFSEGIQRYLITAIDLVTRFTFALAFKRLNSKNAKIFFKKLREVTPFEIKRIQTDNGCEFEKHFREYIRGTPIIHYHNYPKRPQSNAYIERFNRTIQEQFVQWNEEDLFLDIDSFNRSMMDYLIWYNTKKPHRGIKKIPPMKYYVNQFVKNSKLSNMLWTRTVY